ncbi:palmitoleoyl-protein carboxylesterase NOTUM isoform X1 [Lepidochelys kempii]|uniref:palmitoleoyl-protein carboxylesterase NOTUM isoform X1 n=1 Tax=Lepidochelys kempii TaxID=8472 RepID=UPI003C6FAC7D
MRVVWDEKASPCAKKSRAPPSPAAEPGHQSPAPANYAQALPSPLIGAGLSRATRPCAALGTAGAGPGQRPQPRPARGRRSPRSTARPQGLVPPGPGAPASLQPSGAGGRARPSAQLLCSFPRRWLRVAMGRGTVQVLLLLGLLHWGPGGEGRKNWRRRGQQPAAAAAARERSEATGQPVESFPLDFTAVEGNMDSFMAQIKSLAQSLYPCSAQNLHHELRLHLLLNSSVTCNDGSPAGYYLKESKGSRRWLLFLEGGWYCFNRENCDTRYDTMRRLMSSKEWPITKTGTGILSSQPEENPHWWNANMVFIPYCSSDVWSGASSKSEKNEYAFMGALIIQEVVKELVGKGLNNAKVLLLAGSSAGGTGVLLNVDRVAEQLEEMGYQGIQVRGLADSGWFLDNKQYRRTDCIDTITCAPTEAIRRGIRYWNGIVPERCKLQFKEGEEWNCFFGYKIYPTLRCPVFVVQWLFDEAQLTVDNVHLTGQPVQEGQWLYIQNLGRELRNTLKDVTASFAPACLSHEIITRNHWTDIQVKGTSLPRALHCWDRSLHDSNKNGKAPLKGCPIHLIDSCPWPHCNPSCPTIRDQFTGQEMNVIQFLMHMGFDVQKMAQQQGLEPSKLLGMLSSDS